jgi:hypothetical protein
MMASRRWMTSMPTTHIHQGVITCQTRLGAYIRAYRTLLSNFDPPSHDVSVRITFLCAKRRERLMAQHYATGTCGDCVRHSDA